MEITFIGHAAILVAASGLRIISDPWWQGPCFGQQWWIYPRPSLEPVQASPIDYIYISHSHVDHFHRGTLQRFPRGTKVLVSSEIGLALHLVKMGFEIIEIGPDEERDLGNGVRARIIPTYEGDTLMGLSDGREVCLNLNDALHAAPMRILDETLPRLRRIYPEIDYVFCGFGVASHFPNCYVIPGMDREKSAILRQKYFNRRWAEILRRLAPKYGFPFAADVVFLDEDLSWANEPVRNAERPTDVFVSQNPDSATKVVDIAPGFRIGAGEIQDDLRFEPIQNQDVFATYEDEKARKDAAIGRTASDVGLLLERLTENISVARKYLSEFPRDYRFLIVIKGQDQAIEMIKSGNEVYAREIASTAIARQNYDLIATTYYPYLRRAFTKEYGHETLFVGSGIIFEYRDAARVPENLHQELACLLRRVTETPRSRYGDQSRLLYESKRFVKSVLGHREENLYDLQSWTVYS